MFYSIACQAKDAGGSTLYLTDPGTGDIPTATTKSGSFFSPNQLWLPIYNPNTGGCVLKNKQTERLVQCPRGNHTARMVQDNITNEEHLPSPTCVLQIADNGEWKVVRGLQDQDNNMNIGGDPPYHSGAQVYFWGWNGGGSNLEWSFALQQD